MLDMIGAITLSAAYAAMVGVLVAFAALRGSAAIAALAVALIWGIFIVAVAAPGGLAPGTTGPIPAVGLAFVLFFVLLFGSWFGSPQFRDALLSVPLPVLVGLNIIRIGGVFFLLLYAEGRLGSPFAQSAGWGDIITGVVALPLAWASIAGAERMATALKLWNAFGTLDLVVAIGLG